MTNPTRRRAIKVAGATCASLSLSANLFSKNRTLNKPIKLGVIADLHGGLATDANERLDAFLESMAAEECDALIQLGDFAFPNEKHQAFADKFNSAHEHTIHVIGNHEFDFSLTREDCYNAWGIESSYYAYDLEDLRILVLDGNEKGSPDYQTGYPSFIGKDQKAWLSDQLEAATIPLLILSHQPLAGQSAIDNASEIQELLAEYKDKILLCINGHSHVDTLLQVDDVTYLHINSASYYWVGGPTRMAYYQAPLFTTLNIDLSNLTISVDSKISNWRGDSPKAIGYFDRDNAPPETIVVPKIRARTVDKANGTVQTEPYRTNESIKLLKVMTWNIWGRLNEDPRYTIEKKTARERTIEILIESEADIIAMIETYGSAADIAETLGFHHYTPSDDANLCIFSRYPLSDFEPLTGLSPFSFIAATATLPSGQKVRIYDVWLTSSGRHIVEIKNKEVSDEEFCQGDDVRNEMLQKFLHHEDLKKHLAKSEEVPVIVAGDFNCVSHLDHTVNTQHSKLNHMRVLPTKVSKAMYKTGFTDTYREANPDILGSTLGHTWTTVGMGFVYESNKGFVPVEKNPEPQYRDPYTRIDYIYAKGSKLILNGSKVIKHHSSEKNRSFPEFPSDHAAVITEFQIER